MKPILFNTGMVKAILEGRKTTTRRIVKGNVNDKDFVAFLYKDIGEKAVAGFGVKNKDNIGLSDVTEEINLPYHAGDILYVRETWSTQYDGIHDENGYGKVVYKADGTILDNSEMISSSRWYPSIHMPKKFARLFLRVTNVKVERLQEIDKNRCLNEGINEFTKDGKLYKYSANEEWWNEFHRKHKKEFDFDGTSWQDMPEECLDAFKYLWNSTVNKKDIDKYGWNANPFVWVIEFERIRKEEAFKNV